MLTVNKLEKIIELEESLRAEYQDKYGNTGWDGGSKTPLYVTLFAYGNKDEPDDHRLKLLIDDGTESAGSSRALSTSDNYLFEIFESPPSGGDWDEATIDALLIGMEAVIV